MDLGSPTSRLRLIAALGLFGVAACSHTARGLMILQMKIGALVADDEVAIELDRGLIERLKNQATMTIDLPIDAAAREPNGERFDGDFHLSGRSKEVGLPVLVEIMNAAEEREATNLVHRVEHSGRPVKISGAWRVWPEHAGRGTKAEFDALEPLESAYAHHVFEIHPVTKIGGVELKNSFVPVAGYRPGAARRSFQIWSQATATLHLAPRSITLVTKNGLYNDVHFLLEVLGEPPLVVPDGRILMAAARELDGPVVMERLRAVFVKDTPPERLARRLSRGDRVHVWGLPRVDYAEISRRAKESILTGALPIEIVVIAVYQEPPAR
jgi:hypothetical protein